MLPFKCSTEKCIGTVAPTDKGRSWAFGVLRVWTCPYCQREYLLDGRTPTP
jgi:hypothetical protein